MSLLVRFARFWWEFVVGDDWIAAALVIAAIGGTAGVAASGIAAWWAMPLAVVVVLAVSLRRAIRA